MANEDIEKKQFMLSRAKAAVLSRDFELAARLYKTILKENPEDAETLKALGAMYVRAGQDSQALQVYKNLIEKNPSDYKSLIALGGVYRRLDLHHESIEVLEKALEFKTDLAEIYYNLGFTYKLMEMYQDALECFKIVIEENPNDILAYNHLGSIYSLRRDSANAIASYRRGLKLDPNHPVLHFNLAKEFEILGKDEEAKNEYESALKAKPGWSDALNGYASFLTSRNEKHEAYKLLSQGLSLSPEDGALLVSMGDLQRLSGNYAESAKLYRSALNRNPSDKSALLGLAEVYEKDGKFAESIRIFDKIEKDLLMTDDIRSRQISALLSANSLGEASRILKKLWNKNQLDANVWNLLAQLYLCSGDEKRFQTCLKRITEIDPQYREHYRDLGMRCRRMGKLDMSEQFLEKYVDADSSDTEAMAALAAVYEALSKLQESLAMYRRALSLDNFNTSLEESVKRLSSLLPENADETPAAAPEPAEYVFSEFETVPEDEVFLASDELFDTEPVQTEDTEATPDETEAEDIFDFDSFAAVSESNDTYDPLELDEMVTEEDADDFGLENLVADGRPIDFDPAAQSDIPLPDSEDGPAPYEDRASLDFEDEELDLAPPEPKQDIAPEPASPKPAAEEYPREPARPAAPEPVPPPKPAAEPAREPNIAARAAEPAPAAESAHADVPKPAAEPVSLPEFPEPEELELPMDPEPVRTEEIPHEAPAAEEPFSAAAKQLPELVKKLMDTSAVHSCRNAAEMFRRMRDMCEYLPPLKREAFMTGRQRLQLDYVIDSLSGKPGLLAAAQALRESGLVAVPEQRYDIVEKFDEVAVTGRVFGFMRKLIHELPDKDTSAALDASAVSVLRKLDTVSDEIASDSDA